VRETLTVVLEAEGHRVTAAASGAEALKQLEASPFQLMLTDLRMPGMTGIELQQELQRTGIDIPVIIVTAFGDVPMAVDALKDGAVDFLQKPYSRKALANSIDRALKVDREQRAVTAECSGVDERLASLTPREREVMHHLVAGLANRAIAETLDLSVRTVEAHRAEVLRKMAVSSAAGLVRVVLLSERQRATS